MPSLPQSNTLQEIQRAFLERDAELRRMIGDTKATTTASVSGLRKTITSSRGTNGSTTPSGTTTATTVKGRRVITAISTEALSFYETNYTQAEFTESADIISIETNHPAWVRVYSSAAARLEDASRLFADPPVAGTGLMVEVLTYEPDDLLIYLSPVPFWNNCDTVLGKTAYIAVTRWDNGDPENLEMTFTILPQEEMDKNGSQGLPGPRGFTGAGYRSLGEWSSTETYLEGDVVGRNGSVYCSLLNDNLNQPPETIGSTYWTLWASKGNKGDTGATGADGAAATVTVGTVTSGSSPSVENSGTSNAAVLDFVLQKGDKGDTGESSVTLKTDGEDNALQTTLNLIAGANVTLTADASGGVTIASSGGGGSSASYFGLAWPIDSNAGDIGWGDEFTTNTISNWTVVNSAGFNSYGIDTTGCYLYAVPNTSDGQCCGLFKNLTDTSWTVIGKFRNASYGAAYQSLGLSVRNSSTGKIAYLTIAGTGSGAYCSYHTYNNPTSRNSYNDVYTSIGLGGLVFYVKFIRSGDTLQMHLSSDGEHWWLRTTVSIAAFLVAVDQVGIAFGAGGGSRPTLMCDWIRRTA